MADKQTYRVELTVTVEPETDLVSFQPGCWCATIDGTNWQWVGGGSREAVLEVVEHALNGFYRDQDWPKQRIFTITKRDKAEGE